MLFAVWSSKTVKSDKEIQKYCELKPLEVLLFLMPHI